MSHAEHVQTLWKQPKTQPESDRHTFDRASHHLMLAAVLRLMIALTLLFCLVGLLVVRGALAAPETRGWQLVTRINQGQYVSFVSNFDGTDSRQLAVADVPVVRFECSPDGGRLVFVTLGQVHVVRADGSDHQTVSDPMLDEYAYFSISDAGQQVAYSSSYYTGSLWLADMQQGYSFPLVSNRQDFSTSAISPDGTQVIVSAGYRNQNPGLYLFAMDTPDEMTLIGEGIAPVWSPDGSMVVYSQFDGVQSDLMLMDMARGTHIRLTNTPDNENGAAWSPDGQELVFVTYEGYANDTRITLMHWDGTNRRDVEALDGHFSPCILRERPETLVRPFSAPAGR